MIREDYAFNSRKPISSETISYYDVNKSKINILGSFKINCIIDSTSVELTFYVVPIETITIVAILGRDYILSHNNISLIDKRKNKNEIVQIEKSTNRSVILLCVKFFVISRT